MIDPSGIDTGSDRRIKNSIAALDGKYSAFFDGLRPVMFKYNGMDDCLHTGFIAQEVETAAQAAGLNETTLAAIVKRDYIYVLRYAEFIALCVYEIQQLKAEINELKTAKNAE